MTSDIPTLNNADDTKRQMNSMYRFTRHVYNISRKYYLLGRDHLIQNINAAPEETICEIGCGTARNLIKMAKAYPEAKFYGIDASDEILKTASKCLKNKSLESKISLKQGLAQNFDPATLFNISEPFENFAFSYSLSIIPPWKESVNHALSLLKTGGKIHIVDFGGQKGLPLSFRKFLFWWLSLFHVYHKPEILEHLKFLEAEGQGTLDVQHLYKGYAYYAVFKKL